MNLRGFHPRVPVCTPAAEVWRKLTIRAGDHRFGSRAELRERVANPLNLHVAERRIDGEAHDLLVRGLGVGIVASQVVMQRAIDGAPGIDPSRLEHRYCGGGVLDAERV